MLVPTRIGDITMVWNGSCPDCRSMVCCCDPHDEIKAEERNVMNIDDLMKMNSEELDVYRNSETAKILENADPDLRKRLEAMSWNLQQKIKTKKLNYVTIQTEMWRTFLILNEEMKKLQSLTKDDDNDPN